MKFTDVVLLRKKYSNYIFELCFKNFNSPKTFIDEELQFKKLMDYDWFLQEQSTKIGIQSTYANQRIREFSKIPQFDKKLMNTLMEIKVTLKKQKKSMEDLQEKNYLEINKNHNEIISKLSLKILEQIKVDQLLNKMQLAINKTDPPFISYCLNWKLDKKTYHSDMLNQATLIVKNCKELIEEIDVAISLEDNEYYSVNKKLTDSSSLKNSTIAARCTNLSYYVENFKSLYPETLNYKDNSLLKLDLKYAFKYFVNISAINSMKSEIRMKEQFEKAKIELKKTQELFYNINDINRQHALKIDMERKKLSKIAINENTLTNTIIKQWLEFDSDGIYFLFSEHLKIHRLA